MTPYHSVIVATGSYIPPVCVPHEEFLTHDVRTANGAAITKNRADMLAQFETTTGIRERRYSHIVRSDTLEHSGMLVMGRSYNSEVLRESLFLKMEGHTFTSGGPSSSIPCAP